MGSINQFQQVTTLYSQLFCIKTYHIKVTFAFKHIMLCSLQPLEVEMLVILSSKSMKTEPKAMTPPSV